MCEAQQTEPISMAVYDLVKVRYVAGMFCAQSATCLHRVRVSQCSCHQPLCWWKEKHNIPIIETPIQYPYCGGNGTVTPSCYKRGYTMKVGVKGAINDFLTNAMEGTRENKPLPQIPTPVLTKYLKVRMKELCSSIVSKHIMRKLAHRNKLSWKKPSKIYQTWQHKVHPQLRSFTRVWNCINNNNLW